MQQEQGDQMPPATPPKKFGSSLLGAATYRCYAPRGTAGARFAIPRGTANFYKNDKIIV